MGLAPQTTTMVMMMTASPIPLTRPIGISRACGIGSGGMEDGKHNGGPRAVSDVHRHRRRRHPADPERPKIADIRRGCVTGAAAPGYEYIKCLAGGGRAWAPPNCWRFQNPGSSSCW